MKGATLCSGIGAPECAMPWVDWIWSAEIEPFPAAVHAARFPGSVNLGDMTADDFVERAAAIGLPDLIVAGTPCQAFSVAGLRNSLDDDRGNLTLRFVRICDAIDDLRRAAGLAPLVVLWENVPGVFSVRDNAFGALLGGLVGNDTAVDLDGRKWPGAGVVAGPARVAAWRTLDAQFFGVAQRRRRVFVLAVGGAGGWAAADALLPVVAGVQWHPAPRREAGKGAAVSPTLRAGGNHTGGDRPPGTDVDTADSLIAVGFGSADGAVAGTVSAKWAKGTGGPAGDECYNLVAFDTTQITLPHNYSRPAPGDPCHPLAATAHPPAVAFQCQGTNVSVDGDRTGTLRTGNQHVTGGSPLIAFHGAQDPDVSGDVTHPAGRNGGLETCALVGTAVRRLTPTECERLQGFPDGWTDIVHRGKPAADGPRYKAIGNSMAVPVLAWIGDRIRAVLL